MQLASDTKINFCLFSLSVTKVITKCFFFGSDKIVMSEHVGPYAWLMNLND